LIDRYECNPGGTGSFELLWPKLSVSPADGGVVMELWRGRVVSAVVLLALVATPGVSQVPSPPADLPDTVQGRCVRAYVAAFNSGNEDGMRHFFTAHLAPSSLERVPMAQRLALTDRLREDVGELELRAVREVTAENVGVVLAGSDGRLLLFTFRFEPEEPHGLLGIRVEQAGEQDLAPPPPPMTLEEALAAVQEAVSSAVAAEEFSGTVLVARGGEPVLRRAWGLACREFEVPNRVDTRYNLGSINKLFTKVAIGQLVQAGALSFDDTIASILPDYPNTEVARTVTVRHLLEMTSGIGDIFGESYDATPKDRFRHNTDYLPLFAAEEARFAPGERFEYSNGSYIVLGEIVAASSGEDYYDYVRGHIFEPAGMADSAWYEADDPVPGVAFGYTRNWGPGGEPQQTRRRNIYSLPARGSAAGGGYATVDDLLAFTNALLADRLLTPAYTDWFLSGREPIAGGEEQAPDPTVRGQGGVGFAGGAPGINSMLEVDLARGVTIVVMGNYDPPAAMKVARDVRRILAAVVEDEAAPAPER
jgi:CubicO group peptidase (beta-lactamase class C family)